MSGRSAALRRAAPPHPRTRSRRPRRRVDPTRSIPGNHFHAPRIVGTQSFVQAVGPLFSAPDPPLTLHEIHAGFQAVVQPTLDIPTGRRLPAQHATPLIIRHDRPVRPTAYIGAGISPLIRIERHGPGTIRPDEGAIRTEPQPRNSKNQAVQEDRVRPRHRGRSLEAWAVISGSGCVRFANGAD